MLKEHFVEDHGVPRYTVAVGGSGGAIQQYVYAQNHPGLLDAAIPQYSYSDMVTQTIHVGDCELLEHYFDNTDRTNPRWRDPEVRQAIQGLNATDFPRNLSAGEVAQWNGSTPSTRRSATRPWTATRASPAPPSPSAGRAGSGSRRWCSTRPSRTSTTSTSWPRAPQAWSGPTGPTW